MVAINKDHNREEYDEPLDFSKRVSISDIAENLIIAADRILKYHMSIAFGYAPPENFEKGNKDFQQRILDMVSPMIKEYQQTKNITAKSANDVIKMLKQGKISPKEAIVLLDIVSTKLKVEEDEMKHELRRSMLEAVDTTDEEVVNGEEN